MCISGAVGSGAPNRFEDVKVVQILLNLNQERSGNAAIAEDGGFGSETGDAITAFQRSVMNAANPDGRVDPGGGTLAELRSGLPEEFSEAKLHGTMPRATDEHVSRYYPALVPTMLAYDINTPLRQAHFLAQIGHESGALRYSEELASGDDYEGRANLGNTQPGDGRRFKGRGLIQLTGRANYEKYGQSKGRDFTDDATCTLLASDPQLAVDVACWFWKTHGLNELADGDDVRAVTKRVNGGYNGLDEREAYLARSKFFLLV